MTKVTYYLRSGQIIKFRCKSITVKHNNEGRINTIEVRGQRVHIVVAIDDIAAVVF